MFTLTPEEYTQIQNFISEHSGLYFDQRKQYFVEKRVFTRMKESAFSTFRDYYRTLKFDRNTEELQSLLELLTTNETYFYRHTAQLESFIEEAIPLVVAEKKKIGDQQLSIWSAACSSGEEIYTLAIMLREQFTQFSSWKVNLLATDIDRKIISKAQKGIYDSRSVKDVPTHLLRKYFRQQANGLYQLSEEIRSMVRFEELNLIDRIGMRQHREKDVIFCRNALIYFDEHSRKQVVRSLYDSLNKHGFIFLGPSESVSRISAAFRLVKFKKSLSYQK